MTSSERLRLPRCIRIAILNFDLADRAPLHGPGPDRDRTHPGNRSRLNLHLSGATRLFGTATRRFTIPCLTSADGCGLRRASANDNPAFCKEGSSLISAKLTPDGKLRPPTGNVRSATKQIAMIDTCFGTHHLVFASDANDTFGPGAAVVEESWVG